MKNRPTSPLLVALDSLLEGKAGSWVINLGVIPLLVLVAFILPPLALPQRVLSAGYTGISATGGSVSVPDGTQFVIPPGAAKAGVSIKLDTQTASAFSKSAIAQDLPPMLEVKSPLYQPSMQGQMPSQASLSISIPEGIDPFTSLDVYGYSNKKWTKLPYQLYLDEQRLEAYFTSSIPQGVVLVQTTDQAPTISVDLGAKTTLPAQSSALLAEVNPSGLTIAENGGVAGSVPNVPEASASSPYQVLPTVSNFDGEKYRDDLVNDMLTNAETRKQHIQTLVDLAVEKLYPGLNIEYQGANPVNKKAFTTFVRELAQALHAKDKILSVTMSLPEQRSLDEWDTGAFDWVAIGQAADIVKLPLPNYRDAFVGEINSPVHAYLQWATGMVDRYKLQLTFSLLGRDEFGSSYAPISFSTAARLIGQPELPSNIVPDTKITLDLPKLRDGGIKFDAPTGTFFFTYKDDKGFPHTVYIETADSFAQKVGLAMEYNLRGVALRDVNPEAVDARVWDAVKQYREAKLPAYKSKAVIVWRVNGKNVGVSPANDPRLAWTVPAQPGDVKVDAALSFDEGQSVVGSTATTVALIVKPVPTPTPVPTAAPAAAAAPRPTTSAAAPAAPVSAFRGQNLFSYGGQLNWTNREGLDDLKRMGFSWAKIQVRWCDFESAKGRADLSQIDRFMAAANSRGIKVMFSVVCAPNWSRKDGGAGGSGPPDNMQDAADFMGGLAGIYCGKGLGAIEVWNEHNLLTEWHGKPISAKLYMDMLKLAYPKIKAACSSVVVISGAPTPTGVMSDTAIDDVAFLHQLYQNGLKDYSDGIGAHPSGFCNAADATIGTMNPCGGQYNNHRSFFFLETMKAYRAVMVQYGDGNKQVWPTEFGWGVDPSPKPGYDYEKNISPEQQAKWLVQAYQWMKAQGWVGAAILWNLDFMDMGNETGAFHVVGRPAFDALAGMAK